MFTWERIVGVLLLVYAVYVIRKGRMISGDDHPGTTEWLDRKKNPVRFWFAVSFMIVMAGVLIFGIWRF